MDSFRIEMIVAQLSELRFLLRLIKLVLFEIWERARNRYHILNLNSLGLQQVQQVRINALGAKWFWYAFLGLASHINTFMKIASPTANMHMKFSVLKSIKWNFDIHYRWEISYPRKCGFGISVTDTRIFTVLELASHINTPFWNLCGNHAHFTRLFVRLFTWLIYTNVSSYKPHIFPIQA